MSTVADKLARKSNSKTSIKQVRLRLVYIDFWSAVKLSFLAAISLAIVTVVSFVLVFFIAQSTGILIAAEDFLTNFTGGEFVLSDYLSFTTVVAFAAVVAVLNLVVITVLGAVVAGIYNLAVKVTGGLLVGFTSN